jgi:2-amino-4-hydroxy-6-hydroxymethyldihydropteridine diphosphokinase
MAGLQPKPPYHYLIAVGSNRCHGAYGPPKRVVEAAIAAIALPKLAISPIFETSPLGPGGRRFANAACVISTDMGPDALLTLLKEAEQSFGRRSGQHWGDRSLDLDIILWSGGSWSSRALTIPHPLFRARRFVLMPACTITPEWRDPISGLKLITLKARLDRKHPLP